MKSYRNHPWDRACRLKLERHYFITDEYVCVDPGVNYFILQMERLGIRPLASCEGHLAPERIDDEVMYSTFYILFTAEYGKAFRISHLTTDDFGYSIKLAFKILEYNMQYPYRWTSERQKRRVLRSWVDKWEILLKPLFNAKGRNTGPINIHDID